MKLEWAFVLVFALLSALFLWEIREAGHRYADFVVLMGSSFRDRDKMIFELNNRIQTLEKERVLFRRVRELEKGLRTLCVDGTTEMCGRLKKIENK